MPLSRMTAPPLDVYGTRNRSQEDQGMSEDLESVAATLVADGKAFSRPTRASPP